MLATLCRAPSMFAGQTHLNVIADYYWELQLFLEQFAKRQTLQTKEIRRGLHPPVGRIHSSGETNAHGDNDGFVLSGRFHDRPGGLDEVFNKPLVPVLGGGLELDAPENPAMTIRQHTKGLGAAHVYSKRKGFAHPG
jgi:hypothetical protein